MAEAKKTKQTIDDRISSLKKQKEEIRDLFNRILGAIEVLETIKKDDDEKTD